MVIGKRLHSFRSAPSTFKFATGCEFGFVYNLFISANVCGFYIFKMVSVDRFEEYVITLEDLHVGGDQI